MDMWLIVLIWLVVVAFVALAIFLTMLAVQSRKSYRCPECGEKLRVEYLDARRCNVCGSPLNLTGAAY